MVPKIATSAVAAFFLRRGSVERRHPGGTQLARWLALWVFFVCVLKSNLSWAFQSFGGQDSIVQDQDEGLHLRTRRTVIVDAPGTLCAQGNDTRKEYDLHTQFDRLDAFSACPLIEGHQVYSAMGLDVGCIQHEGVRLYCCVSQSNLLQQEGIFIMPAWQCYTAPRLNAAERTAWEDHNEYFWKTAQLEPHRVKEVRGRRRVLATAVGVFHQISGGKENIKKGSLLDLGSNLGYMLAAAHQEGFGSVVGLEPNKKLAAASRAAFPDLRVVEKLTDIKALPYLFDMVTAFDVLEHRTHPYEFMREVAGVTEKGGVLLGEVPDFCPKRRIMSGEVAELEACLQPWLHGADTTGLLNSQHLYHFSYDSVRHLLQSSGFTVVHLEPSTAQTPTGMVYLLRFLAVRQ